MRRQGKEPIRIPFSLDFGTGNCENSGVDQASWVEWLRPTQGLIFWASSAYYVFALLARLLRRGAHCYKL